MLVRHGEYINWTNRWKDGRPLSPVHTSNNVEATLDFLEATFDFVPETATMSYEFIIKMGPFDKVECCFDIVAVFETFGNNVAGFGNNVKLDFVL